MTRYIAVIGPGSGATGEQLRDARTAGRLLAQAGAVIVTGGLGGVMAAAASGAAEDGGTTIGLLPGSDREQADAAHTFTLPTGLGELRNGLVVRAADAVLCIGGSWGTLSEVALAVRTGKTVVSVGGWRLPEQGVTEVDDVVDAVRYVLSTTPA